MLKGAKRRLLNYLLAHLFNAVTEADVLTFNKATGRLMHEGVELPREETERLARQAGTIQELAVWNYITTGMKWEANKKMYISSRSDDDIIAGKWMLFTQDVIEQKLYNLTNINR